MAGHFPLGRLSRRIRTETDATLTAMPVALVPQAASAILATVLALQLPTAHVINGSVDQPPVWESLIFAVAGAVGGVVLVFAVVATLLLRRYFKDPQREWRLGWADHPEDGTRSFELWSMTDPPAPASSIADLEIQALTENHTIETVGGHLVNVLGGPPQWSFYRGQIHQHPCSVRVYSTQPGKPSYEVLRATIPGAASHPPAAESAPAAE
jgi:hypothetical protein